jgi:werner syndrome-like exonuclease
MENAPPPPNSLQRPIVQQQPSSTKPKRQLPFKLLLTPSSDPNHRQQHQILPSSSKPPLQFNGTKIYARTSLAVETCCRAMLESGCTTLGWDIEWRVTYQSGETPRPVAVMQFCPEIVHTTKEGRASSTMATTSSSSSLSQPSTSTTNIPLSKEEVFLLHITHSGITPSLIHLLSSPSIAKVGCGAHLDALKVQRDFKLECQGIVDLSYYAVARLPEQQPKWALNALVSRLFHKSLDKSADTRCSNWESPFLNEIQKTYAANDTYASLLVYQALREMVPLYNTNNTMMMAVEKQGQQQGQNRGDNNYDNDNNNQQQAMEVVDPEQQQAIVDIMNKEGSIPCGTVLSRLSPAPLSLWQEHVEQGVSLEEIARRRNIRMSTAESYLAAAIISGRGYNWKELGLSDEKWQHVTAFVEDLIEPVVSPDKKKQEEVVVEIDGGGDREKKRRGEGMDIDIKASVLSESPLVWHPNIERMNPNKQQINLQEKILILRGMTYSELREQSETLLDLDMGKLCLAMAHLSRCNYVVIEKLFCWS